TRGRGGRPTGRGRCPWPRRHGPPRVPPPPGSPALRPPRVPPPPGSPAHPPSRPPPPSTLHRVVPAGPQVRDQPAGGEDVGHHRRHARRAVGAPGGLVDDLAPDEVDA